MIQAINNRTGKVLATNVRVADTLFTRMKGLLGRKELPQGEALWIKPCFSVHTFFMQFPIDVLFLNKKNQVIAVVSNLTPNRLTRLYPNHSVSSNFRLAQLMLQILTLDMKLKSKNKSVLYAAAHDIPFIIFLCILIIKEILFIYLSYDDKITFYSFLLTLLPDIRNYFIFSLCLTIYKESNRKAYISVFIKRNFIPAVSFSVPLFSLF